MYRKKKIKVTKYYTFNERKNVTIINYIFGLIYSDGVSLVRSF